MNYNPQNGEKWYSWNLLLYICNQVESTPVSDDPTVPIFGIEDKNRIHIVMNCFYNAVPLYGYLPFQWR